MNNASLKSFFLFSRSQRLGLLMLVAIIIVLQIIYYTISFETTFSTSDEQSKWLLLNDEVAGQEIHTQKFPKTIRQFNPNFITDFKGYQLGMSVDEINRLLAFRSTNKYVNSIAEFQAVTHVSDSLLQVLAPHFKFPDWVTNKTNTAKPKFVKFETKQPEKLPVLDINSATKEDLMKINGIGNALSDRILKQKEQLNAFVSMDQMEEIWGLSPEVILKLKQHFVIQSKPELKKIAINTLSLKELSKFYYFKYPLAKEIVIYRSMNGNIKIDDLTKIKGFPVDKIKIIALYLEF